MAQIHDDLLIAKRCPPGAGCTFTWTLTTTFGPMLREVETLFGPRDTSYTILGIEFSGSIPQIWFPGNCRHIAIQLGEPTMMDPVRARYQLAHETVHLLDPVVVGGVSVFEEGLATYYQLEYIHREAPKYSTGDPKYDAACQLATKVIAGGTDGVRALRAGGKKLSMFATSDLTAICPGLTAGEATTLRRRKYIKVSFDQVPCYTY
jgi:hypothetical protein